MCFNSVERLHRYKWQFNCHQIWREFYTYFLQWCSSYYPAYEPNYSNNPELTTRTYHPTQTCSRLKFVVLWTYIICTEQAFVNAYKYVWWFGLLVMYKSACILAYEITCQMKYRIDSKGALERCNIVTLTWAKWTWLKYWWFVCLFDLILYVPLTIFQLYWDGSSWVEPVLS